VSGEDSAGSQLPLGSGTFVIIDYGLLRATVEGKNLLSSSKIFICPFFNSNYTVRQIYLIHRDGLKQGKGKKATFTWHSLYARHCS